MKTDLVCVICHKDFQHGSPHTLTCSETCRKERYLKITGREGWQKELPTGTVGAITEMMVALDLMRKGYAVFRSLSPSCFCDLIAIKDKKVIRIEARTGYTTSIDQKIRFPRKTHGEIDCFGIYIPALSNVAYFDTEFNPFNP